MRVLQRYTLFNAAKLEGAMYCWLINYITLNVNHFKVISCLDNVHLLDGDAHLRLHLIGQHQIKADNSI